jgi:hypothetical protein
VDLIKHARRELTIRGETEEVIQAYLDVIKAFIKLQELVPAKQNADETVMLLVNGLLLTPLTDWPNDWYVHSSENYHGFGQLWQSKRNMRAFSSDQGKTFYTIGPGSRNNNTLLQHDKRFAPE